MKNISSKLLIVICLLCGYYSFAQEVNVSIDLEKQRFLGEESNLNRSKYFNVHNLNEEPAFPTFLSDNNVGFGRRFFDAHSDRSYVDPIANFPDITPPSDGIVRPVRRFVATSSPTSSWAFDADPVLGGQSAVNYWLTRVDTQNRPEYWEPFNEPFIKAEQFSTNSISNQQVVDKMSEWHREMARAIHATPELANMKVIGFGSAFPSYARRDFRETWQNHMKRFIDIAGDDIDALSIHPYDGINQVGQSNGRSGSNSEAILDLVETYTAQLSSDGATPTKLAITEFGVIGGNDPFPPGPAPGFNNDARSALSIAGFNNMFFNFFERQDNIEICVPFTTGRGDFYYNSAYTADGGNGDVRPYPPAYLRPTELFPNAPFRNNEFVLTFRANFYEFWKDVKGDRAKITSDNLDVQVQAFVDGNTAYIALNNLDSADQTVNLTFVSGPSSVTNVVTSSIVANGQNTPIYDPGTTSGTIPASVELKVGETKILAITYGSPINFTSSIRRTKYYASTTEAPADKAPTVPINAGQPRTFTLSDVQKGTLGGDATLRLGVGIPLTTAVNSTTPTNLSRVPSGITFNGDPLPIPTNWRGYDQADRFDFFGVFEIPVPIDIVNNGTNIVTVTYEETGGRVASVVLSLENNEAECTPTTLYADEDNDGLGNPDVTIESCSPVEGFVDNADDVCIDDPENACNAVNIPGVVQAEEFTENNGTTINGTFIESINNGDSTTYDVNNTFAGEQNIIINASAANGAGGTVRVFSGADEVGSVSITSTGDTNTYQDFEGTITLQSTGLLRLRFEYSGTGSGDLFNIDSITFISTEEIIRFSDPNIGEIIQTIPNTATSFTLQLDYTTDTPGQRPGIELRRPDETFFKNNLMTEATPVSRTNVDFTINFDAGDLPLPTGDYRVLTFIITETSNGNTFTGGDGVRRFIRVVEPAVTANDDVSENNPRDATISLNILANDQKEDGTTPAPGDVTVDIDQNTGGVQSTLVVANEGTWSYDPLTGILSFEPNTGFVDNPTDITYSLTEIANMLSDLGMVNFEYVQPPVINNDTSIDNDPGVVTINILDNDEKSNGDPLTAAEVTVDLDPNTPAIENTLSAGVLGDWSYNPTSGVLSFTPNDQFSANPPVLIYQVEENATGLSSSGQAVVTYRTFTLAEFIVKNTGETCASENNGMIEISASTSGNYTYQLNGAAAVAFTQDALIENLDAGNYNLIITDTSTQDSFVFDVAISEPEDLSVSTRVSPSSKQVTLRLSGSNIFRIKLNDTEFTTRENELTLRLKDGANQLQVQGDKECQGDFNERIIIGEAITAYPNPTVDFLTVETAFNGPMNIELFDISGKLVTSKFSSISENQYRVDTQGLKSGVYLLHVTPVNSSSTSKFKIVKQ